MMEMLLLINLDMKLNWCGQDKNNHVRVSRGGEGGSKYLVHFFHAYNV